MTRDTKQNLPEGAVYLRNDEGRKYNMGTMKAVFKADEAETQERYSVSEWWLEPNSDGPGAHLHQANDEIFYVLEGTAFLLIGEKWIEATKGAFFIIPKNTMHDFANRSNNITGLLNFFIPGGFERNMPSIVNWFEENR